MKKYLIILYFSLILIILVAGFSFSQSRDIIETESSNEEFREERVAFIVGVNNYLNINNLNYAVSDAELMKETLEEKGMFTTLLFTDNARTPSKYNIMKTLREVNELSELGLIKTFVFFFGGHGFQENGKNYLAPTEINPDDISGTGVNLEEVLNIIDDVRKNAKVMVFLDACRNDPSHKKSVGGGFADTDSKGLGVLFSTKEGDYSYEDPKIEHGIYTKYLTGGLNGEADIEPYGNNDGFISFEEVSKYVSIKMRDWSNTNEYGYSQIPRVTQIEKFGDFYLTKTDEVTHTTAPVNIIDETAEPTLSRLQKNIETFKDKGFNITDITCDEYCFVVASQNNSFTEQVYYIDKKNPEDFISQKWVDGYLITSLNYINGYWVVIMSYDLDYGTQVYTIEDEFPEDFYWEHFDLWYSATELNYLVELDKWVLVMSKDTHYSDQYVMNTSNDVFPKDSVKKDYSDGYFITDISFSRNKWKLIMSNDSQLSEQRYDKINRSKLPEFSKELWENNYSISDIVIQDNRTLYVVSNKVEGELGIQGGFVVSPGTKIDFYSYE